MKKNVAIGIAIGVLFSLLLGVIYAVMVMSHNKNRREPVDTTVVVEESTQVEVSSTVATEVIAEEVEGYQIVYGDFNETIILPYDAVDSYNSFMEISGVQEMLGEMLFDISAEWDSSTYAHSGDKIHVRGSVVGSDGFVDVTVDLSEGTATLESHVPTVAIQSREDFTRPGAGFVKGYPAGSSLSEVDYNAATTQEIKLKEFSDFDELMPYNQDGVSQTFDVVLRDYTDGQVMKDAMCYYTRKFFGDGEILVWDYERLENSVVIFYYSLNGWNIAMQVGGDDPYVLYATAEPSRVDESAY